MGADERTDSGEASAGPRETLPVPTLVAHAIQSRGEVRRIAVWCDWCESVHEHGAGGGEGGRAPHCSDSASPLRRTGYRLRVVRRSNSHRSVVPDGLMVGHRVLHRALADISPELGALVLRAVLGCDRGELHAEGGTVRVFGDRNWLVEPKGLPAYEGVGLIQLAGDLFGLSPGVVAVRLLEAASLDRLDEPAAFELQAVIERWLSRGAPRRPEF